MRNIKLIAFLLFGAFLASEAQANLVNLGSLKNNLTQKKASWQPKDSWLNALSLEQIQRVLGYKQKVMQGKDFYLWERMNQSSGTDAIDWRSYNGQNWVTPILNQGNCGSCVAFATVATLETQVNISRGTSWLNPRYSEEALFACGGGGCDWGWSPSTAASYLRTRGVPDEACAPYTMGATGVDASCSSICSDASSRSQQISNYNSLSNPSNIKAALKHGPVVTTMDVYADFIVYGSGIYKHVDGDYLGGHALSIVGFNDAQRYWIVRNSWGKDWGENGFVRISYDDISGIGDDGWSFQIPNADGVATIRGLQDRDYISGKVALDAISTYPNTSNIALQLTGPRGGTTTMNCNAANCPFHLDSSTLADGRYEANLQVTTGGKKVESEKKYFYIVNNRPAKLDLSFQPVNSGNVVRDRVEYTVDATSSTVPFSSLTFYVKQGSKVVETRDADIVLPHMTMGWRTTVVPNGTYDIYLQGKISSGTHQYQVDSNHFTVTVQN